MGEGPTGVEERRPHEAGAPTRARATKKDRILTFYTSGVTDIEEIADLVDTKPSYVASVLQDSGLLSGYFDLYTHSAHLMNVYSKYIAGRLGFKDEEVARQSVELLEAKYIEFETRRDRAGQHHILVAALTLLDRARWIGKMAEAEHFRRWLISKLIQD